MRILSILGCPKSRITRALGGPQGAPKSENFEHSGVSQIDDYTRAGRPTGGSKMSILGCPKSRIARALGGTQGAPKRENFEHFGVSQIEDYTSAGRPTGGSKK